jgi:tRNA threonylcarbamoyl adenosine modification protein (Sua5/YciO/YrdC/YwlC family)
MAQRFLTHVTHPQRRLIAQTVALLREGALVAYPTDSCYALGCTMDGREAQDRARQLRGLSERHYLTLVCPDLSVLSVFAKVDNPSYRLLRAHTPGPYTFVLKASRDVPRRLQDPKRRTVGIRVPDHPVCAALLEQLGEPLLSTTLRLPDEDLPLSEPDEIMQRIGQRIDVLLDAGACGLEPTTMVDLSGGAPQVVREGAGDASAFR